MSSPKHEPGDSNGMPVGYVPLSEENSSAPEQSIGSLVKDATQHMSTLVRAEIELAKAETVSEVKKATKGSIFFAIAGVVALYSSFFFFFFLGELLSEWLYRWAAFAIVFGLMVVTAALFGLLGWRKFKKVKAPQRSIDSVKETAAALKPKHKAESEPGLPSVPDLDTPARR